MSDWKQPPPGYLRRIWQAKPMTEEHYCCAEVVAAINQLTDHQRQLATALRDWSERLYAGLTEMTEALSKAIAEGRR